MRRSNLKGIDMQFLAKQSAIGITQGQVYYGSIIYDPENQGLASAMMRTNFKIVVYNDNGHWTSYMPFTFEPVRN